MVARIVIGNLPGGTTGVRVSQAGYDAMSNPVDNTQMIFNSDWPNAISIIQEGELTTTSTGTEVITDIAFPNLGYAPLIFVAYRSATGSSPDHLNTTSWISYQNHDWYTTRNSNNVSFLSITTYNNYFRCRHLGLGNVSTSWWRTIRVLYAVTNFKMVP